MKLSTNQIKNLEKIVRSAGDVILEVYKTDFEVDYKSDESPLTIADQSANDLLVNEISKLFPETEFITEETKNATYEIRKKWDYIWIIDPLDGTKEFVKKNGEFTVNVALAHKGEIIFGMILVPVTGDLFYAQKDEGSFKIANGKTTQLYVQKPTEELIVVASRSHRSKEVDEFAEHVAKSFKSLNYKPAGSSLKLCLIAEGKAHIYPRLGPTMEWDTAAGHIIAEEAGAEVIRHDNGQPLEYNKENLLNPYFIVTSFNFEN